MPKNPLNQHRLAQKSFDRMCKIGIRIWFIDQREMPPFLFDRFESMTHHRFSEDHPVPELFRIDFASGRRCIAGESAGVFSGFRITAPVGMTFPAEPVESSAHIHFLFGLHIEQRQVDRAAAAVT